MVYAARYISVKNALGLFLYVFNRTTTVQKNHNIMMNMSVGL